MITIKFRKNSFVTFYDPDTGKKDQFCGTDVKAQEVLSIFKDVVKASTSVLYLRCYDDSLATIPLDDIAGITIN